MIVKVGSTDVTTYFVLRTAADGTATTGATITDIDLQYVRSGDTPSAKVDATELAATNSAHDDNKAKEIDGTDAPGLYRVDWPDAAFASGVREVILSVKLASSFTEHLRVELSPAVDAVAISGDGTAADNLEAMLDGTGEVALTLESVVINNSAGVGLAVTGSTTGITVVGSAGPGIEVDGTTHGIDVAASAGPGVEIDGTTFGIEVDASAGIGLHVGGTTHGVEIAGSAGPGVEIDGTTYGVEIAASAGEGMYIGGTSYALRLAASTGHALSAVGGSSGYGMQIGSSGSNGIKVTAGGNYEAMHITGAGTASAIHIAGAAHGIDITATAGPGIEIDGTTYGIEIDASAGTGLHIGGTTHGIQVAGSAGPGIEVDGTTFGMELDASAGPGLHVGGTTYGLEATASAGSGASFSSSGGNGHGITVAGNGTGEGLTATGGATGHGIAALGGGTSGDGFYSAGQTLGHGMTLVAAGGSRYDLNADIHGTLDTVTAVTNGVTLANDAITAAKFDQSTAYPANEALNAAIPGSPTADSVNERVKAIDGKLPSSAYLRGTADSDGGMSAADKVDIHNQGNASLALYNLDHLMKAPVANNADMTIEVPDGTVLSNIMSKTSDTSTFVVATDSFEALADDWATTVNMNRIADHVIRRLFVNACDSSDGDTKSGRSLLGAIARQVNKVAAVGTTLTIYEDDDTTSLFTQTLVTDATADPVTSADTDP